MTTKTLIVTDISQSTTQIQFNRPSVHNALNTEMLCAIGQHIAEADERPEIQCVILTGTRRVFAAGADVSEIKTIQTGLYPEIERRKAWQQIRHFRKPIIAAVNGFAFGGGCELALHADILIASKTAQFSQPEIRLGLMPGAGGTQYLPSRVGKATAMLMNLTAQKIDAQKALDIGLISELVDSDDALPRAHEIADRLSTYSQSALISIKNSILKSYDLNQTDALAYERSLFLKQARSTDALEGIDAFLEKRRPHFNT